MTRNPRTVDVIWSDGTESGTETVDDVETWWYEDLDLKIETTCGEIETFPAGDVIVQ